MQSDSPAETFTLDDLQDWAFSGVSLAVLGQPVRHSISPQMHNAALAALAKSRPDFANWKYFRFEIDPSRLQDALPLFWRRNFHGLNLTVPHKEIAVGLIDAIDPVAHRIGAVNTLLRNEHGYQGFNTDGYGISRGIRDDLAIALAGANVLLLGAGGAARAAAVQCLSEGCSRLNIVNRNAERLQRLLTELGPLALEKRIPIAGHAPASCPEAGASTLIINATTLGLKADDICPLPDDKIGNGARCYDMIYNPSATQLMNRVVAKGGRAANGLSMLIAQGARALEIWTGAPAPTAIMAQAACDALSP